MSSSYRFMGQEYTTKPAEPDTFMQWLNDEIVFQKNMLAISEQSGTAEQKHRADAYLSALQDVAREYAKHKES